VTGEDERKPNHAMGLAKYKLGVFPRDPKRTIVFMGGQQRGEEGEERGATERRRGEGMEHLNR